MKSVLALVVILHLCDSLNTSLTVEIISELQLLMQFTHVQSSPVYMPSKYMYENSHVCAGLFFRELRVSLSNLQRQKGKDIIEKLLAILDSMEELPVNDQRCRMEKVTSKRMPITHYIRFLRKLNLKTQTG